MRNPLAILLLSAAFLVVSMGAHPSLLSAPLSPQEEEFVRVSEEMLLDPDPADWLMAHRTYDVTGYSPLDQINSSNVGQLKLAWMRAMDVGPQELRPLVYNGVMFVAHPGSDHIQAWDATTGDLIWDYKRELPTDLRNYQPQGNRTRSLAIYDDKIYHMTWDSYLVALHAGSGELLWESKIADYKDGITHSSGALIVKGKVISGRSSASAIWACAVSSPPTTPRQVRSYGAPSLPLVRENREETPGEIYPMSVASMSLPGDCREATIPNWIWFTGEWRCRHPILGSSAGVPGMSGTRRPVSCTPTPHWPWTPTQERSSGTTSTFPVMTGMPTLSMRGH